LNSTKHKKVCICIPIYKSKLSENEKKSLIQCLKILNKYDIYFFTYKSIKKSEYNIISNSVGKFPEYKYFKKYFFKGIDGYNKIMFDKNFYQTFSDYENILIYQLDAWVFRDELEYWCDRGYDYVGAPWFVDYLTGETYDKPFAVGNGGLSLRKTSFFIKTLDTIIEPFSLKKDIHILLNILIQRKFLVNYFQRIKRIYFHFKNYVNNIILLNINEDAFYCLHLSKYGIEIKLPSCNEASKFAFEHNPSYLYEQNGKMLPFGCHAWEKIDFNTFWNNFIE
jgi:hypothetical protein